MTERLQQILISLALTLLLPAQLALGYISDPAYGDPSFMHGAWDGKSDIRIVGPSICVQSTQNPNNPERGKITPYRIKADMFPLGRDFEIVGLSIEGFSQIPFTVEYQWNGPGGSRTEQLGYNQYSGDFGGGKEADSRDCGADGSMFNASIVVTIYEADLRAAINANFVGWLRIVHEGGQNSGQSSADELIRISVNKSLQEVQIKNLNDIDLGRWDGSQAYLQGGDDFCVYSSSGSYSIRISSNDLGNGGAGTFGLSNAEPGATVMDYDVYFKAGTGAGSNDQLISNGQVLSTLPASPDLQCAVNSSSIYLRTTSSLESMRSGLYRGEIILRVEPE